ncbi:ABC transporter ATP-binding protein [uncultured Pseudacidovorax sp.]|uniref:ABC transporter ATP-binding protein n=1 Tax=uncultured Pseudacidovorax sp. TaxID=679313 RepID=UPI0025F34143|nr:ABC transporter ATP-binding protein [uncultured Pseudacidovorax sp.]
MSQFGSVRMEGVVKKHGSFTALHGMDLSIHPGEFFALLGPSGSGKTTTLRILAGLEEVNGGRVWLDDADVTHAQPGERDVAMVFQSYALYPHMTVAENIAFPLKMIDTPKAEIEGAVKEAAAKVNIGHLLARKPGQLSGGQQQRCALARAIVRKPRLFLLDEPLSNLDAKLRIETRAELRRLQRALGVTAVYVTHDQEEAMTIADRVAVFMEGRLVQTGTPKDIFMKPATVAVAGFIGTPPMNLLNATVADGLVLLDGAPVLATEARAGDVVLGMRPGDLRIAAADMPGLPARVEFVEDLGDALIVHVAIGEQRAKLKTDASGAPPAEGQPVRLAFAPEAAHLFDRASGQRL